MLKMIFIFLFFILKNDFVNGAAIIPMSKSTDPVTLFEGNLDIKVENELFESSRRFQMTWSIFY